MSELLVIDCPDDRWPDAEAALRTDAAPLHAAALQREDPTRLVAVIGSSGSVRRARSLGVHIHATFTPTRGFVGRLGLHGAIQRVADTVKPSLVRSIGSSELVETVARAVDGRVPCEHHSWRTIPKQDASDPPTLSASHRIVLVDPWPGSSIAWLGRSVGMFGALRSRLGSSSQIIVEATTPSLGWAASLFGGLDSPDTLRVCHGSAVAVLRAGDIALMPTPWGPQGWLGGAAVLAKACRDRGAIVVAPAQDLCSNPDALCTDHSPRGAAEAVIRVLGIESTQSERFAGAE